MDGSGGGENAQVNVFGEPLATCSDAPRTGWFRSGCCETDAQDVGSHTVCAVLTEDFLRFWISNHYKIDWYFLHFLNYKYSFSNFPPSLSFRLVN